MIPKTVKFFMLLLAVAMVLILFTQYQHQDPVTYVILFRVYIISAIAFVSFYRVCHFARLRALSFLASRTNTKDLDRKQSPTYKITTALVAIGASALTFMINPIGGAFVAWRSLSWVKQEWRDLDEAARNGQERSS